MQSVVLKAMVVALAVCGFDAAQGQNSFAPPREPDKWQQLSPDNRNEMRREYLENLPPNEKRKLRSQVKRFHSLSPTKKQELCRRFEKDRGYMPPACQKLF
ncbi:MAG: DUF3106 domain-containing protein [Gammaproteobacteria bacterium]|nr:DUF3106 domain-containing protein [Gammaproteobacteria bacterium]